MKHYKSVEFLSIFRMSSLPAQCKAPRQKRKAPLKTFWQRFWNVMLSEMLEIVLTLKILGPPKIFGPSYVHCMKTEFWMTSKKRLCVILGAIFSKQIGRHFFQIKGRWAPIFLVFLGSLPRFSGILRRFSQILPRFTLILPGFSPNQNFWGCACTPASYTTAPHRCGKRDAVWSL